MEERSTLIRLMVVPQKVDLSSDLWADGRYYVELQKRGQRKGKKRQTQVSNSRSSERINS